MSLDKSETFGLMDLLIDALGCLLHRLKGCFQKSSSRVFEGLGRWVGTIFNLADSQPGGPHLADWDNFPEGFDVSGGIWVSWVRRGALESSGSVLDQPGGGCDGRKLLLRFVRGE